VVDGEDEEILTQFATRQVSSRLALGEGGDPYLRNSFRKKGTYPRGEFFDTFTTNDPGVLLRLGKIFAAATKKNSDFPTWATALMEEATKKRFQETNGLAPVPARISPSLMEEILEADRLSPGTLINTLLSDSEESACHPFIHLADLRTHILKYEDAIKNALNAGNDRKALRALEILNTLPVPLMPFAPELIQACLSGSHRIKSLARGLMLTMPAETLPLAVNRLDDNEPAVRAEAASLLGFIQTEAAAKALQERLEKESDESVREAVADAALFCRAPSPDLDIKSLHKDDPPADLNWDAFDLLKAFVDRFNARVAETQAIYDEDSEGSALPMVRVSPVVANQAFQFLQAKDPTGGTRPPDGFHAHYRMDAFDRLDPESTRLLQALMAMPEFQPIHLLRLLILVHTININDGRPSIRFQMTPEGEILIQNFRNFHKADFSMHKMAAMLKDFGWDEDCLVSWQFDLGPNRHKPLWSSDDTWPYFAGRLDILKQAMALKRSALFPVANQPKTSEIALEVLATFPKPPREFLPVLWDLALGPDKTLGPLAQKVLEKQPGAKDRVQQKCQSAIESVRQAAMKWQERIYRGDAL
jgi:hypothetical protein